MADVLVDTDGRVWKITTVGGTQALPLQLCAFDLIPKRLHWSSPTATAGDQVILVDGQGREVYQETALAGAYNAVEQWPGVLEQWSGPITIKQFDSGTLLISI